VTGGNTSLEQRVQAGDTPADLPLSTDADRLLDQLRPEVALIATRSPIADVKEDILRCVERGVSVVTSSEELAYPDVTNAEAGREIEEACLAGGSAVVATGINPGFVFDVLPVVIAGASWDVRQIFVARALDCSVFGRTIHRALGVGYSPSGFEEARKAGIIRGHIGFEESAMVIAETLGRPLDDFEEDVQPLIADRPYRLAEYVVSPGQTAGVVQEATGWVDGQPWMRFDLSLHVDPESVGIQTRDHIRIEGENTIDVTIRPGTQAILTTSARMVNSISAVLVASPGLYTAADLLPAAPWLNADPPPGIRRRPG
jgi:4-hydroxy-tetrahydrodipicolinate reductase